jgi:hypothetical protein
MSSAEPLGGERQSRRQFLRGAGGLAGAAALGGGALAAGRLIGAARPGPPGRLLAAAPPDPARTFHSRPQLHPAALSIAASGALADGYLFLGPGAEGQIQAGPLIADNDGEPVWFRPRSDVWVSNFRSFSYLDDPVLTWWEGVVVVPIGYGRGTGVIVDRSYRHQARIRPVGGAPMDMHELRLTPEGTALFTCYPRWVRADLSAVGGPRDGRVLESVFQEVDVRNGRLLLEWRSLEHVPVQESYEPLQDPYDYLHLNSIAVAPDGNLLVSGRHTWTVYKLDRASGQVIWRLGGKRSDFGLSPDARFSWQHDAEQPSERVLTVFDNGYDGHTKTEPRSRGMVLELDEARRTARLAQAFYHSSPLLASAMGSVQILPDGHVLVGWGSQPYVGEFAADGRVLADVRLAHGQQCYRSYRLPWIGQPHRAPAIRATRHPHSGTGTLYASWNGATELASWQVHAGARPSDLRPVGAVRRQGFETVIPVDGASGYAAVSALDATGRQLRRSRTIRL